MAKIYKSEAMTAVHEMMDGFRQTGAIDKQTMWEFDEACLTLAHALSPGEVKAIRNPLSADKRSIVDIAAIGQMHCSIHGGVR